MKAAAKPGPLTDESRTFHFDPLDPRKDKVTITLVVEGEKPWIMLGPKKGEKTPFAPGTYQLVFDRNSPLPLTRVTIDPDPGGGRIP